MTTRRPDSESSDPELVLLQRWRAGDKAALDELIGRILPWLHSEIRRSFRSGGADVNDSMDLVQTTVLNFLTWGPRFMPGSGAQFRALLRRIATNEWIDLRRRSSRAGRHFESLLPSGPSLSGFGPRVPTEQLAIHTLAQDEEANWVRLALQFLEPDDRFLLLASEVEDRDWASIARELNLATPDAARVRAARLKPKVANLLRRLKSGQMPAEAPVAEDDAQ